MRSLHEFTTDQFQLTGVLISREEFSVGTDALAPFSKDDHIFLKDVHLHEKGGKVTALPYFVLQKDELMATTVPKQHSDYHLALNAGQINF